MTALALVLLTGCKRVDPAPEDLDGLLHYLWQKAEDGSDAELADAAANLHEVLDRALEADDGGVSALTDAEVALARLDRDVDPSRAVGLYIADPMACDLATVEAVLISRDQAALYDVFDSYERVYTSDLDAWLDRDATTLTWDVTYTTRVPFAGTYTADLAGGIRRADGGDLGELLVSRTVLVEPAEFEDEDRVFDQEYRAELHYAPRAGTVVHVEALWRHMDAGAVSTDSAMVQRLILNGLLDWDDQTEVWCEAGLP